MTGLITLTQAAERMNCSRQWVHYLIKNGRLKATLVGERIYVLREKDVDACDVRPRAKPAPNGHTPSVSPKKARTGQRVTAKRKKKAK